MKTAFGLDIAGYATGKSALARADRRSADDVLATIYLGHVFSNKVSGDTALDEPHQQELELLTACVDVGPIFIDAPLDLQGLPFPEQPSLVWELVKRPVDYAFSALPAFADRIGAPVSRLQHLLAAECNHLGGLVGKRLFETYPAASLQLLNLPHERYKRTRARFEDGQWHGENLARIAHGLGLTADEGTSLNDDELDAVLCALTGIADRGEVLQGEELAAEVLGRIQPKLPGCDCSRFNLVPVGYVLLGARPSMTIRIEKQTVNRRDGALREITRGTM